MNFKNLLYSLTALAVFAVGCNKDNDTPTIKDAVLKLTSESTMEFTAEGGEGVITYTLENAVEGVELKAECNAKWITNLTVGEEITFTVDSSKVDARETKIVVSYQELSFEVVVKQAKLATQEYLYDLQLASAQRVDSAIYNFPENYVCVIFLDKSRTIGISIVFIGDEADKVLSSGTYTIADGTIMGEECELQISAVEKYTLADGKANIVVEVDADKYHIDGVLEDAKGNRFHITFEGEIQNMIPGCVNFEAKECDGYCYGACSKGSWEYVVSLSDLGLDVYDTPKADATYYKLDLFGVEGAIDADGMVTVPAGTYTFDADDTLAEWTIGNEDSMYMVMNSSGTGVTAQSPLYNANLVVTESNATLTTYIQGIKHVVTYEGALRVKAELD